MDKGNVQEIFDPACVVALTDPDGRWLLGPSVRQFVMIGVCGGYTTFWSFSLQTLSLAQDGEWFRAAVNSFLSFGLCLIAVWFGHFCVTLITKS